MCICTSILYETLPRYVLAHEITCTWWVLGCKHSLDQSCSLMCVHVPPLVHKQIQLWPPPDAEATHAVLSLPLPLSRILPAVAFASALAFAFKSFAPAITAAAAAFTAAFSFLIFACSAFAACTCSAFAAAFASFTAAFSLTCANL